MDTLGLVTCYYNPCHYEKRLENFRLFAKNIRHPRVSLLVIELAFGDDPFELPEGNYELLRLRSKSIMWQKERLLNIGLQKLAEKHDCIAWIDADVVFEEARWADKVLLSLERFPVVSMASKAVFFDKNVILPGYHFAQNKIITPYCSGCAWAYRTEVFKHTWLYENCIVESIFIRVPFKHAVFNLNVL